jgi:uncharacterized membrane protein
MIFLRHGREKEVIVPEHISFVPDPTLLPWQVNLIFKGDAVDFDEDGFYATVLDLHRRGILRVTEHPDGEGVDIEVIQTVSDDAYEQRVINFVANAGSGGVLDTRSFAAAAKAGGANITSLNTSLSALTKEVESGFVTRYVEEGRGKIVPLIAVGLGIAFFSFFLFFLSPATSPVSVPAGILGIVMVIEGGFAALFPTTLFGKWKEDYYAEKLKWDGFSAFLSDSAMIERYSPADLSMWGEWLVYGTALGVGDKVEEAMKNLSIDIHETGMPHGYLMYAAFMPVARYTPPSSSGGFGGGRRIWWWWWIRWRRCRRPIILLGTLIHSFSPGYLFIASVASGKLVLFHGIQSCRRRRTHCCHPFFSEHMWTL